MKPLRSTIGLPVVHLGLSAVIAIPVRAMPSAYLLQWEVHGAGGGRFVTSLDVITDAAGNVHVAPVEGGPAVRPWMLSVAGGSDPAWAPDGGGVVAFTETQRENPGIHIRTGWRR